MEVRGNFSTYELTSLEKDTFADYLQHSMNNPAMEFIKYLMGDDYIRFIDIMSGTTLKIPSQKTLVRDLESVKMYLYTKKNNFSETSVREAAKLYGKTALTARRYIYKVARVLGSEDMLEGDALNNYISYIKSVSEIDSYYQTKAEARRDEINENKKNNTLANKGEYIEEVVEDVVEDVQEEETPIEDSYTLDNANEEEEVIPDEEIDEKEILSNLEEVMEEEICQKTI